MRVAITSSGNSLDSSIDRRFGRCAFFVIYDTESKSVEFIPNPNKEVEQGAGPASVQIIASRNVNKVVSGEFGMKIKPLLDKLNIQMIALDKADKSIQDIIEMLTQ